MHEKNKSKWFVNQVMDYIHKTGFRKLNLPSTAIFYLISLAKYADNTGYCCPSQHEIENFIGLSASHQFRYLSLLKKRGIITTKTKYSRRYKMNRKHYTIHLDIILNIGIDEKGDIKIEKVETNNECKQTEQLSKLESHSMDQLSKLESPTIKLTTQLKDTNYPTKENIYNVQNRSNSEHSSSNIEPLPRDLHFEDFWATYPRKEKKGKAREIWIRERLDSIAKEIIDDVRDRQVRHDRWENRSFIPMPTTYLNQEGWKDEIIERRKLEPRATGIAKQGNIRDYAEQLLRAGNKINNPHLRAIQNNLAGKVDEEF